MKTWSRYFFFFLSLGFFSFVFPIYALAGTGIGFDYSLTGNILHFEMHEPHLTNCDNWASSQIHIYEANGDYLNGDFTCVDNIDITDNNINISASGSYILALYEAVTPEDYFTCAHNKTYAQGQIDCSGIANTIQTSYLPESEVNPSIASFSVIGSSTALSMIAGVASGVRDTGFSIWYIVAGILGITIAFYAFYEVKGVYRNKKDKR